MRFITEFEIMEHEKNEYRVQDRKKAHHESRFTKKITEAFGWQNTIKGDWRHYKLEIEAFPMGKWVHFKRSIYEYVYGVEGPFAAEQIKGMIEELESFGKPSGDTITNPK